MSNPPPTSDPSPLSSSGVPSSFDSSPEFFEESRPQKLWRKIRQEPLIPLGCAATCYALYQASKSIRAGDHHQTNRMFRARIYAQGFTLVALVAGSIFYKDERLKRKVFEGALEEKKAAEKREKWLRELEVRDQEERAWRDRIEEPYRQAEDLAQRARGEATTQTSKATREVRGEVAKVKEQADKVLQDGKENLDEVRKEMTDENKGKGWNLFGSKSIKEEVSSQGWGPGMWVNRTMDAWRRI